MGRRIPKRWGGRRAKLPSMDDLRRADARVRRCQGERNAALAEAGRLKAEVAQLKAEIERLQVPRE